MTLHYTILVADDDRVLLDILGDILAEPGYTVLTAGNGYEAIRILADRHVDLMIADVDMPGLDGIELGLQAKVMRPNLHIVFISGGVLRRPSFGAVLQKPLRRADLLEVVAHEMAAH
jgi:CheY-like chemotaxis protein